MCMFRAEWYDTHVVADTPDSWFVVVFFFARADQAFQEAAGGDPAHEAVHRVVWYFLQPGSSGQVAPETGILLPHPGSGHKARKESPVSLFPLRIFVFSQCTTYCKYLIVFTLVTTDYTRYNVNYAVILFR